MPAAILQFVSRAEQLRLRGGRNFARFMMFNSGRVAASSPERCKWLAEDADERCQDATWAQRHGPVHGGAIVVVFQLDDRSRHAQPTPITQRGSR